MRIYYLRNFDCAVSLTIWENVKLPAMVPLQINGDTIWFLYKHTWSAQTVAWMECLSDQVNTVTAIDRS